MNTLGRLNQNDIKIQANGDIYYDSSRRTSTLSPLRKSIRASSKAQFSSTKQERWLPEIKKFSNTVSTPQQSSSIQKNMSIQPQVSVFTDEFGSYQIDMDEKTISQFLEIFRTYDIKRSGYVEQKYLYEILAQLSLSSKNIEKVFAQDVFSRPGYFNFEELLEIITELEIDKIEQMNKELADEDKIIIKPDQKVIDLIKKLDNYRKLQEREGNYKEAYRAHLKILQLRSNEQNKQIDNLRYIQDDELLKVTKLQSQQLYEFDRAWEQFLKEYDQTSKDTVEALEERHVQELEQYSQQVKQELALKQKFSKHLLDLRYKEQMLVKLKNYPEAEKIKIKADQLEEIEKQQYEIQMQETVENKVNTLRKQQEIALQGLIHKIEQDRQLQLKQRDIDAQTLLTKNKALLLELNNKHITETKKAQNLLKENMVYNDHQELFRVRDPNDKLIFERQEQNLDRFKIQNQNTLNKIRSQSTQRNSPFPQRLKTDNAPYLLQINQLFGSATPIPASIVRKTQRNYRKGSTANISYNY
ncbi:hypothetical protein ABPG74_021488 [Tetrahymena malaccensis]